MSFPVQSFDACTFFCLWSSLEKGNPPDACRFPSCFQVLILCGFETKRSEHNGSFYFDLFTPTYCTKYTWPCLAVDSSVLHDFHRDLWMEQLQQNLAMREACRGMWLDFRSIPTRLPNTCNTCDFVSERLQLWGRNCIHAKHLDYCSMLYRQHQELL